MCLGDWKTHGSEYYECSRYKENPDIVNQSQQAQAREALKKYLFYFERVGSPQLLLEGALQLACWDGLPVTGPRATCTQRSGRGSCMVLGDASIDVAFGLHRATVADKEGLCVRAGWKDSRDHQCHLSSGILRAVPPREDPSAAHRAWHV